MREGKRIETLIGKHSDEHLIPPMKECDGLKEEETEDEFEKKGKNQSKKNWKDKKVDTRILK